MTVPPPRASFLLGVQVHHVTMAQAVAHLRDLLRSPGAHQVVTLNATMLGRAAREDAFRRIVNSAALVTPDGMGTLLVGRILGVRFAERVAGVDLTDRLCAMCAREGLRVFLFGAAPGVADDAARRLMERHPGLAVSGTHHGYVSAEDTPRILERIRTSGAHLLLVAMGSPRQEEWLAAHLPGSGARVGMGIGGTLDVHAGRARLAPEWIRAVGLEWVYRVLREPRRWRAATALPGVIWLAVKERLRRGLNPAGPQG